MPSYNQDYHYGKSKEPFVINHLAKYFKQTIVPNSNRFALFDAESETTLYEIKAVDAVRIHTRQLLCH